jgi:hypothetical protein
MSDNTVRPLIFDERGVPEHIELPKEIFGLYHRHKPQKSEYEYVYDRIAIITSDGWVPLVDYVDMVIMEDESDDTVNDIDTFKKRDGSGDNIVVDPVVLRKEVQDDQIQQQRITNPVTTHRKWSKDSDIEYYIPDMGIKKTAEFIKQPLEQIFNNGNELEYEEMKTVVSTMWGVNKDVIKYLTDFKYEDGY